MVVLNMNTRDHLRKVSIPIEKVAFLYPFILMNSDLVELMEIVVSMRCTKRFVVTLDGF